MYAMLCHFSVTSQTAILSTDTSVFLKQIIIVKSFNSVLIRAGFIAVLRDCLTSVLC